MNTTRQDVVSKVIEFALMGDLWDENSVSWNRNEDGTHTVKASVNGVRFTSTSTSAVAAIGYLIAQFAKGG